MNPGLLIQLIVVVLALLLIALIAVIVGFIARKRGGDRKRWRQRAAVSLVVVLSAPVLWVYFVNPMPSDEVMIKHLNAHRAEYEELAIGFIQAKKAGDEAVKVWLASPRTLALKKTIQAKDERNVGDEPGQWFSGVHANTGDNPDKGSIEFFIEGGASYSWREMNWVWKTYLYFPIPPQATDGHRLQCPEGSGRKCLGPYNIEILESLNGYPRFKTNHWRKCGAFAKKIDGHWYIQYNKAC